MNSFLFNHLKFQIASFAILMILEVIYFFRPKIKLLSNRIFSVLMISALIYLLFDVATVFALVYYEYLPLWFVRFTHQGFIVFLDICLSCIYLYIDILNRNQRRYSIYKFSFICFLYLISLLTVIFAPIEYYREADGIYSYGLMVKCVYAVIIYYSVMTVIKSIRHLSNSVHRKQQIYVLFTMALWIGFGVTQIFLPKILISSVGVSSMILLMFLSLENPSEYIDTETRAFNYYALKTVLEEFQGKEKPFKIIKIEIEDFPVVGQVSGVDVASQLLLILKSFMEKNIKTSVYRLNRTSLAIILNEKQLLNQQKIIDLIEKRFTKTWSFRNTNIRLNGRAYILNCPEDFPFSGKISELIDFLEDMESYSASSGFLCHIDSNARQKRARKLSIIKIITEAIEHDGIEMYYQPIYNLETKKFSNAEALVRLKDSTTLGFISPEEFIPIVEKSGQIIQLSEMIFNHVFSFMGKNNLSKKGINHIEVNLSGLQSVDADLPKLMKALLNEYKIKPESVNLEITESIAITSGYMLKKNMEELKKFGCSFAMDDFGTGYSNLSRMSKGDFELIKIDKSLLWPCFKKEENSVNNAKILLENMIGMLLKMGRKIVVEGIETKEQFEYLESLGITYAQGFYFSKPLSEEDFLNFLENSN
ncbi:MAG: EAL domain-containing protein [Spirochaetales bacterium]|nr:EAL domain-containing protein [Spirochaetales bacterium]